MGLFKKRTSDPAELDSLRSEIASMAARLAEADARHAQLAQLDQRVNHLAAKVDAPPPLAPLPTQGPDTAELDMLRARVQRLSDRIDQSASAAPTVAPEDVRILQARVEYLTQQLADALAEEPEPPAVGTDDLAALDARIAALQARIDAIPPVTTPTSAPPPPPPAPSVDPAELDALREHVERLDARLAAVDARITSISTELANQLTEISGDLDALASRPAGEPPVAPVVDLDAIDELVDELRDTQTRLANEQARYQIAFRQDLADLAERLRRPDR